jgi:hypothetical protein
VSRPRQDTLVSRFYNPGPSECARAVELLLKPISKKAAGSSGGEDARKEDPNASGKSIIPKRR